MTLTVKSTVKPGYIRKGLVGVLLLGVVVAVSGCQTLSFYAQAIKGQYQIFAHEQSVKKLLADGQTPAALKEKLKLLQELRAFAAKELKLPIDDHYLKYTDVHRPYVVWNVEAAPELSLEPKGWWYPMVGRLEYRGYFSREGAHKYAARLREKGYDVYVGGVRAYSTLGWFKDPVLNTFIFEPKAELAEIIFHELGHQRVFARGDTDFNEAFATTVGEEGARRWLRAQGDAAAYGNYLTALQHNREFVQLIMQTRARLETVYGDERTEEGKAKATKKRRDVPVAQIRQEKQRILEDLERQCAKLAEQWNDHDGCAEWFSRRVNNAQLNSVAAYYDLVPGFEQLLKTNGGNLEKFYEAVERLSKKPKKERHQWLRTLGAGVRPEPASGSESWLLSRRGEK